MNIIIKKCVWGENMFETEIIIKKKEIMNQSKDGTKLHIE